MRDVVAVPCKLFEGNGNGEVRNGDTMWESRRNAKCNVN